MSRCSSRKPAVCGNSRFTMRRVRRLALLTVAAAVVLALAAAAFAGPRDPRVHKRPADVRWAKTLILKLRDLPAGFVDKGPQKDDSGPTPPGCKEPNLHALVETADVSSHNFERNRASFAEALSETSFFLRPAQAQTAVAVDEQQADPLRERGDRRGPRRSETSTRSSGTSSSPSRRVGSSFAMRWCSPTSAAAESSPSSCSTRSTA